MTRAHRQYLTAMLMFGFNGILASYIPWHSYEIVLARTSIGALFMLLLLLLRRQKFTFREEMRSFRILVISGVAMGLNWMCLYEAYDQLGVGLAQLICCSGPALAMVLSPFIFKERLQPVKLLGFAVVLGGMFLIFGNDLSGGGLNFGLVCGIAAACFYAALLICNRMAPAITGPERTMWQLAVASVVVFLFILTRGTGVPQFSVPILIPVLLLGTVFTGVGMNFLFAGVQKLSSQTVGICGYLEPLSALIFSALLLGERLTAIQVVGVVCILGGTAFSELYHPKGGKPIETEANT